MIEIAVRQPSTAIMQMRRARMVLSDVYRLYEFMLKSQKLRMPGQLRSFQLTPDIAGCVRGGSEVGYAGGGVEGGTSGWIEIWFGCILRF
jgi:hypothetical protein